MRGSAVASREPRNESGVSLEAAYVPLKLASQTRAGAETKNPAGSREAAAEPVPHPLHRSRRSGRGSGVRDDVSSGVTVGQNRETASERDDGQYEFRLTRFPKLLSRSRAIPAISCLHD